MRLEQKVALITGGSQGLGLAMAKRFEEEGAIVYIADVCAPKEKVGQYIEMDVTQKDSVHQAVEKIIEDAGHLDVLVNNAGIIEDALVNKMTEKQWMRVIDVNLKGAYLVTQEVVSHMYQQGKGSIINISSIVGEYGNIGQTNYAATKAGLIGMTYTWAKEFTRKGAEIRTNAIAPGYADTEMMQSVPQAVLDKIIAQNPMHRLAKPIEIANAALFLASDEASYINGQVLGVNGGQRL